MHFGRFHGPNFGGIERHVGTLLACLKERIGVVNVVANDGSRTEIEPQQGYDIHKLACIGTFAGTALCPTMPWHARQLFRSGGYDIAHLHFPDPMAHLAYYCLPKSARLVISWHSDIVRQKRLLTLYRPFLNHVVARADAIVAATPKHFESSTQLSACTKRAGRRVVPYGIDFSPLAASPANLEAAARIRQRHVGKRIVFALGRHVYYKGFDTLLAAMASVSPEALLILGGSGPLTDDLRGLAARLDLGDRVVFAGRIPDEVLPHYYHACDLFCLPSAARNEAFGLVQAEAMACAKPVVCCELHNGTNYVNQSGVTGLTVPPGDVPALAAAIDALLGDEARRLAYGQAASARVRREFTLDNMTEGMLEVYRDVLAGK